MSHAVAKLYYGATSFWSAVVRMTVVEKGYGDDEVEFRLVDLGVGDNYKPEYLLINPYATVPSLVVPLEKSIGPDMEVKYKALTDSKPIVEFLDKSRSVLSPTNTTSAAPAPVLTPATISHLNTSAKIIDTVRGQPSIAAYTWSARSERELLAKANNPLGAMIRVRSAKLQKLLVDNESFVPQKALAVLQDRFPRVAAAAKAVEAVLVDASNRTQEQQSAIDAHIDQSNAVYTDGLSKQLAVFEQEVVGPLCLGDQISLADMYLAAWVTRLVFLLGGDGSPGGVTKIPGAGPKIVAFWECIIERPSWKAVYGEKLF